MARWLGGSILALALGVCMGCGDSQAVVEPGVTAELAQQRRAAIADLRYRLHFHVPDDPAAPVNGSVAIRFNLADASVPLQVDFTQASENVFSVRCNGNALPTEVVGEHLLLSSEALKQGANLIEIDFASPPDAFNRNPEFLYTLFVPDRARSAFPLFDQPDLKARYQLSVDVPASWRALSSAPEESREVVAGRARYTFAVSKLLSSYQFSFVAGAFESISREVHGRSITLLHRETDNTRLQRNLDAVFTLHADALAWLEEYTGIAYPFQTFDFVLIPDFPYGGMEHVGAIQYRASALLIEDAPSDSTLLNRAQLIAHETAHMWFGNLVTMRWFNDVWTKEVFANFMADKIVNPAFPAIDHALNFLVSHYPSAYAVDRSEGANPIRQPLANLNMAGQLYGPIIYHKAPIMMRQLELLLGEEGFRDGMREYLQTFIYGNASWPELIAILDARTDVDLGAWSEVWVHTPGMPSFLEQQAAPGAGAASVTLVQSDPAGRGRIWPQRFGVLAVGGDTGSVLAPVVAARVSRPAWPDSPPDDAVLLYNADGVGYGLFPFHAALLDAWSGLTDLQKGVTLSNAFEQLLQGALSVEAYMDALLAILQQEHNQLLVNLVCDQLGYSYFSLLTDERRDGYADRVESTLWNRLMEAASASMRRVFFERYAALATSPAALERVRRIWDGSLLADRLALDESDQIALAEGLAIRLPNRAGEILQAQLARIENPDRRRRLAFIAPALSADEAERDHFFASLARPEKRATERWVTDALGRLHHPSRLAQAEKYLLPSLELVEEIQATGDIFFPSGWLQASLGNHHSSAAVAAVRSFLAARPDYNPQLRMKILQAADPLFRANRLRAASR